ncbi:MAG: SAM-dependent methyltransferase [Spirochaetia bacterium]
MKGRRIETTQSRTAEMTCGCRAASWMEKRAAFRSGDWVAPLLLPRKMQALFKVPVFRRLLTRVFGPEGVYEWVIARTRYIDGVFERALSSGFAQVLIIGAGFDTRAIRFKTGERGLKVFELDAPTTQNAKLGQYKARRIAVPPSVSFVAIDFEKESIRERLSESGFCAGARTLVIAEGVFQYLKPEAAMATLQAIKELAGAGSWFVFDYAHASALRGEGSSYGEARTVRGVRKLGESWQYGLDEQEVKPLLAKYSFTLVDLKSPRGLEDLYFKNEDGKVMASINGTQSIALAQKI